MTGPCEIEQVQESEQPWLGIPIAPFRAALDGERFMEHCPIWQQEREEQHCCPALLAAHCVNGEPQAKAKAASIIQIDSFRCMVHSNIQRRKPGPALQPSGNGVVAKYPVRPRLPGHFKARPISYNGAREEIADGVFDPEDQARAFRGIVRSYPLYPFAAVRVEKVQA